MPHEFFFISPESPFDFETGKHYVRPFAFQPLALLTVEDCFHES